MKKLKVRCLCDEDMIVDRELCETLMEVFSGLSPGQKQVIKNSMADQIVKEGKRLEKLILHYTDK